MDARILLRADALTLGYPGLVLAEDLRFDVARGDTLAVVGHNGSGKTTFVKSVLGLHAPLGGQLVWPGGRPKEIGYLAQMTEFDRRFPLRVRDLAAMGAWRGLSPWAGLDGRLRARVEAALDRAGIADIAARSLHTLSGGQLQRALFARVIVQDAPLILLDEPFAAVDQATEVQLLSLIRDWAGEGRGIVLVMHDLSSVLDHCSHALLLGQGRGTYGRIDTVLQPDTLVAHGYMSASQADWMFRPRTANDPAAERAHV